MGIAFHIVQPDDRSCDRWKELERLGEIHGALDPARVFTGVRALRPVDGRLAVVRAWLYDEPVPGRPQVSQALVDRDSLDPSGKCGGITHGPQLANHFNGRFLQDFIRQRTVLEHARGQRVHRRSICAVKNLMGLHIPPSGSRQDGRVNVAIGKSAHITLKDASYRLMVASSEKYPACETATGPGILRRGGRDGGTGRRAGFKIRFPKGSGGSIPPPGTTPTSLFVMRFEQHSGRLGRSGYSSLSRRATRFQT